jgi:hypothetical protein
MRDWVIVISLVVVAIIFVFYWRYYGRKFGEGMAANTELIKNGDFISPIITQPPPPTPLAAPPTTPPVAGGKPTVDETTMSPEIVAATPAAIGSIKISPETAATGSSSGTGTPADIENKIGWIHAMDISLCAGANGIIPAPTPPIKQYILLNDKNTIEQSVSISDKGVYEISVSATGTNPIVIYLKTGDVSQNINIITPTNKWTEYKKQFTINNAENAGTITEMIGLSGTGTGITAISGVSLKMRGIADSNENVITAIDMSKIVIEKNIEQSNNDIVQKITTHEDVKFTEMLAAINNIQGSVSRSKTENTVGITKYSGY